MATQYKDPDHNPSIFSQPNPTGFLERSRRVRSCPPVQCGRNSISSRFLSRQQ
ncbi:hypothetical protein BofuT4_uP043510.1 [Botrytis cinerea T4]|uniref:Uncharacterized protein n=1 Tax=Botryotinia fuckeliana (strain T4) TaxID=999810 RepID=G2Y250_BOTF4|nr:hypothetical protein BofuT4_uP043510.1 [Botrytis cinerea T4]